MWENFDGNRIKLCFSVNFLHVPLVIFYLQVSAFKFFDVFKLPAIPSSLYKGRWRKRGLSLSADCTVLKCGHVSRGKVEKPNSSSELPILIIDMILA